MREQRPGGSVSEPETACADPVTLTAGRRFFSPARELALLRRACARRVAHKESVNLEIASYRPRMPSRFREVVAFALISDDWPGMGETCLGIVHERGWNVHYAHGLVFKEGDEETVAFIMAVGLETDQDADRMKADLPEITNEMFRLGIGRRAKMLLLAKEAKKLALLSRVVDELASLSTKGELREITKPQGEAAKFFAARTDEYMTTWPPSELAYRVLTNYRLMGKVRGSGGFGSLVVENRNARDGIRTCISIAGRRQDISVEDCLRVLGDTLDVWEQYHLVDFTTKDGLLVVHLEVGSRSGRPLSETQQHEVSAQLNDMLAGKRVAWAHNIEARGGLEQYARAIIPFLMKEYSNSKIAQVYVSPTTREQAKAGFKVIFVYGSQTGSPPPSLLLPDLLQSIPGIEIESVVPPRTVGEQQFFIINIKAKLSRFEDTEGVYSAVKERIGKVFKTFRDFDEGMRRLDTTRLKQIESEFSPDDRPLVDRIFYAIDEFSRINIQRDEIVGLIRLGLAALREFDTRPSRSLRPVLLQEICRNRDGSTKCELLALALGHGHGIPSCITALSSRAQVTVSQIPHGEGELVVCRIAGEQGGATEIDAIHSILGCMGIIDPEK